MGDAARGRGLAPAGASPLGPVSRSAADRPRFPERRPIPAPARLAAMACYEEDGSWNLSFSGSGFLGLYHVGVTQCLRERAPRLLQGDRRIYGSSSGALNAMSIIVGKSVGASGTARARRAGGHGLACPRRS